MLRTYEGTSGANTADKIDRESFIIDTHASPDPGKGACDLIIHHELLDAVGRC